MEMSSFAVMLNTAFAGFDRFFLSIQHFFGTYLGFILTPLMRLVTFLGEKGIVFLLAALFFMCFAKTRKLGVCIFGAVCCGALLTNIILKDMIARPRPFESSELFRTWWVSIGSPAEEGFSFPSGHVTATAAGMTAITLIKGRKWVLPSAVTVLVMAVSRNYLMAHYPTDVLAAAVIGTASAFIAWYITRFIFALLHDRRDIRLFEFILNFNLPVRIPAIGYKGKHEQSQSK